MVTMNGEECHNEWEITFEEVHRNGAIAFAIFNYQRYTGDYTYTHSKGIYVLIAISRFWYQRFSFSEPKQQYVMLGVTGPNEYENNVNNNFYTNYIAKWCMEFTVQTLENIKEVDSILYSNVLEETNLSEIVNQDKINELERKIIELELKKLRQDKKFLIGPFLKNGKLILHI